MAARGRPIHYIRRNSLALSPPIGYVPLLSLCEKRQQLCTVCEKRQQQRSCSDFSAPSWPEPARHSCCLVMTTLRLIRTQESLRSVRQRSRNFVMSFIVSP